MFPPELHLVIACCRWPHTDARVRAIRTAAAVAVDWDLFGRIVERHRVDGLVHDGLTRADVAMPPPVSASLAAAARAIARENLIQAAASMRLSAALDASSIPHLFVKGVTLGVLAYGSLAHKRGWDIDLAVEPARYAEACAILEDAGYRCESPGADAAARLAWAQRRKHGQWAAPGGLVVELHAQLTDNPHLLPGLSAAAPTRIVAVAPGIDLPTLTPDALFAYLCVHGAAHAWSRLKWIADVAALLADADAAEISRLHRAAVALGAGRCGGQALLLIARLFDRPPPSELGLERDPVLRALVRTALASMVRGGADRELDAQMLGTVPIHLSHFALGRGWRYRWSEARRKLAGDGGGGGVTAWLTRRRARAAK